MLYKEDNFEIHFATNQSEHMALCENTDWNRYFNENLELESSFYVIIDNKKKRKFCYNPYLNFCFDEKKMLIESDVFFKDKPKISNFFNGQLETINQKTVETLKREIIKKKVDYKELSNHAIIINNNSQEVDINFIVTARGRKEFAEPLYRSFLAAKEKTDKIISFTIVEHAPFPEHGKFFKNKDVNYIFIRSEEGEVFNKCLAYNAGAIFTSKAKYLLFHDLDIVVQSDFFINILANVEKTNCEALQCYTNKRVLFCTDELSKKIINKEITIDSLSEQYENVSPPINKGEVTYGSKGGSILITQRVFNEIGGFDPELFEGYSAEDQFFWDKVLQIVSIEYADDPKVELFHLWHPPAHGDGILNLLMEGRFRSFQRLEHSQKKEILKLKQDLINGNI